MKCAKPFLQTMDTRAAKTPPKTADKFYSSPGHREWRARVIARAGGACETPGCGRRERRMFAHHVKEIRDGGARLDLGNGACLCGSCHERATAAAAKARRDRTK